MIPRPGAKGGVKQEVIGLIPAAGKAVRLDPSPLSKEIFPVGFQTLPDRDGPRPKVACQYTLERMRRAGIRKVFVVLSAVKWDVASYLGDGSRMGLHLAYLVPGSPHGAPFTLDQAFPFLEGRRVALGFPDLLIEEEDVFSRLIESQEESGAEVMLGLFPARRPHACDMVEVDGEGRLLRLSVKPESTDLTLTWGCAVWSDVFSRFMHRFLPSLLSGARHEEAVATGAPREFQVGHVLQAALREGLDVRGELLSDSPFLDIGTPEDLLLGVRRETERAIRQEATGRKKP